MRFDQPLKFEIVLQNVCNDFVGMLVGDTVCSKVDVRHGIDHSSGSRVWILNNLADRIGLRTENGFDLRMLMKIYGVLCHTPLRSQYGRDPSVGEHLLQ